MTYAVVPAANSLSTIILEAARSWRLGRDRGAPVQPGLYAVLVGHGCGMLAPVFDSLMTLCEAALGRRIVVGDALSVSDDEHLLLGLLDGSKRRAACIECEKGPASSLDCAICSTRVMLRLAA